VLAPAPWLAKLYPLGIAGAIITLGKLRRQILERTEFANCAPRSGFYRGATRSSKDNIRLTWCWPCSPGSRRASARTGLPTRWSQASPSTTASIEGRGTSSELTQFLDSGPAPIVFTLGSSAVMVAGDFYVESAAAAAELGRRAVMLVGRDPRNLPARTLPAGVIMAEYAPFSELFPRAAAIVHQGGTGTTAQALAIGTPPCWLVPFAHDQPDNAARVVRMGVARQIGRSQYRAGRVAAELRKCSRIPVTKPEPRKPAGGFDPRMVSRQPVTPSSSRLFQFAPVISPFKPHCNSFAKISGLP